MGTANKMYNHDATRNLPNFNYHKKYQNGYDANSKCRNLVHTDLWEICNSYYNIHLGKQSDNTADAWRKECDTECGTARLWTSRCSRQRTPQLGTPALWIRQSKKPNADSCALQLHGLTGAE
jgi:hypothetical protein